jgi:tRNA(fMet)-specific endonuclease VapC
VLAARDRSDGLLDVQIDVRSFPILPYDDAAAEWHGRERARLEEIGRTPPFVDGQIAAIAHSESLTLVTANTGDYQYFGDLEIADWTR